MVAGWEAKQTNRMNKQWAFIMQKQYSVFESKDSFVLRKKYAIRAM